MFYSNQISEEGVKAIAEALKLLQNITSLKLELTQFFEFKQLNLFIY